MFKDETLSEKLLKKWFWLYLFTFLAAPLGYIVKIILTNEISVSELWVIYSIISFITLIALYNDFGLTSALKYFLPKYRINKDYNSYKTAILLSISSQLFTSIIFIILIFNFADFLSVSYFQLESSKILIQIFCIYFLFYNINQFFIAIFQAFQDTFYNKLIFFIRNLSITIFVTTLFFIDVTNYIYYWFARVVWITISWILLWIIFLKKYWYSLKEWKISFNKIMLKEYINRSFWIFLYMNANIILTQIDQQMVIYFLWPEQAWYFTNYLSLILLYTLILYPFLSFYWPVAVELIHKKQFDKLSLLQWFLYKYLSVFIVSIWVLLFTLWEILALIFFWEQYIYSWYLLKFSWLFIVFSVLLGINNSVIWWFWNFKLNVYIILSALILNVIWNYFLVRIYWSPWIVSVTAFTRVYMFVVSFIIARKYNKTKIDFKYIFSNLILIIILWISIYLIIPHIFTLKNEERINNLIYLIILWIVYYSIIWVINIKNIMLLIREVKKNFLWSRWNSFK